MNIIFKYRMLSDESDNFVRDFEVYPDMTLAEFHDFVRRALRYDDAMVSIFKSDAEWRPVEEFGQLDMGIYPCLWQTLYPEGSHLFPFVVC